MGANSHCFNVELAKLVGLEEAIILQHLYWWYQHNRFNPEMLRDGMVWVFRSVKEMRENFPYLSDGNIRTAIKHLVEKGLVVRGDYSERSMNKAIWYALTDSAIRLFDIQETANPFIDSQNGFVDSGKSIDNSNKDSRKDSSTNNNIYSAKPRFVPPTLEEVTAYCRERNNGISAESFIDYYTANGWKVGGNPMRDWKAAVRTWEARRKERPTHKAPRPAEERRYLSPEERTMAALARLQARDGMLHTFDPDEQ